MHCTDNYKICVVLLSITRTFASGKTEKLVMQHLKDLGFASGKVRTITADYSCNNKFTIGYLRCRHLLTVY